MGRVTGLSKTPPKGAAALLRKMASSGSGMKVMASALGTTDPTLYAWLREHPDLNAALCEGREKARVALHDSLQRRALNLKNPGGVTAAIFLLKTRHEYRENDAPDEGNKVNIIFNLPAALPVEKYVEAMKKLNGARTKED